MNGYEMAYNRLHELVDEMLRDNPVSERRTTKPLLFSEKSREIINDIANYSERTALYERMKHQREEFERDLHETPDLIYRYMLDRVANAPTKIHMISSIILLMPVLRRLLQEREDENNCDSDIASNSIANNIPDCSSD